MLSRIMRHPAGLVRKALSRKFLAEKFLRPAPQPAPPPDYWLNRFSGIGLILVGPVPRLSTATPVALVHSAPTGEGLLPAQGGKASSFLDTGRAERMPASRP